MTFEVVDALICSNGSIIHDRQDLSDALLPTWRIR